MSDHPGAQKEREVRKWAEGIIYIGVMWHVWVHIISSAVVQIILININVERF